MKVAVIQQNSTDDKQKNIDRAVFLIREALRRRAEFILLPEAFNFRGATDQRDVLAAVAEDIPGESTRPLLSIARRHRVFILAGTICEKTPASKKFYNTSVLINPRGHILARYRKMHLFEAVIDQTVIKEARHFLPGTKTALAAVGPFKVGMSVCYDVRFPSLYEDYAAAGAHVFCVPSAFTKKTGQAHWETLLRARAIENLCYVLAPNQTGKDSRGVSSYGHSMIVGPWGEVLAEAGGSKEEILFADLKMDELKEKRKIIMMRKKRSGQSTIEYMVLVAAVIVVLLVFMQAGGPGRWAVNETLATTGNLMVRMANAIFNRQ